MSFSDDTGTKWQVTGTLTQTSQFEQPNLNLFPRQPSQWSMWCILWTEVTEILFMIREFLFPYCGGSLHCLRSHFAGAELERTIAELVENRREDKDRILVHASAAGIQLHPAPFLLISTLHWPCLHAVSCLHLTGHAYTPCQLTYDANISRTLLHVAASSNRASTPLLFKSVAPKWFWVAWVAMTIYDSRTC